MDQKIKNFIKAQPLERQSVLTDIHGIILEKDKTAMAEIAPMMGKEMMMYKSGGSMKYALASVKKYMSLHVLPIYGSKTLYEKYKALLDKAIFQKGCINFESADQMPLDIVRKLITDCAKIDLVKIREEYLKKKKLKAKK